MADFEARTLPMDSVTEYHTDWSWTYTVMDHFRLGREAFGDFLACFFPGRQLKGCPLPLPTWVQDFPGTEYLREVDRVSRSRSWSHLMPLKGVVHLEFVARDDYKMPLHRDWLAAVEQCAPDTPSGSSTTVAASELP